MIGMLLVIFKLLASNQAALLFQCGLGMRLCQGITITSRPITRYHIGQVLENVVASHEGISNHWTEVD